MIEEFDHPAFIPPDFNNIIWRYMSFEKFKSLIDTQALFFCRADRFSDPFEGSVPKKEVNNRIIDQERISNYFGKPFNIEKAKKNIHSISIAHRNLKRSILINCWHINNNESDGMWHLYLKSNEGVAIKTTVRNIMESFNNTAESVYISKVRYINYETDIWFNKKEYPCKAYNFFTPFVHKRIEFVHESELRLLCEVSIAENDPQYWLNQEFEKGKLVSVNLDVLIQKVILPPTADDVIENKVRMLLNDRNIKKDIIKSNLSLDPRY